MRSGRILKQFSARDGRNVTLRTPKWEDLDDLLGLINSLVIEKADVVRTETVSREEEVDWLSGALSRLEKDEEFYMVAGVDNRVVANSEIRRKTGNEKHVGGIGIAIKEGFRDIGIGAEMMKVLIKQSEAWGLKVLTLSVFASSKRAVHVYERAGFVQTGIVPRRFCRNGEYTDEIIMTRLLG